MSKSLFLAGLLSASAVMAADVQYFVGAGIEKGDVDVNASALGLTLSDNVKDTALKLKFGVLIDNEHRISLSNVKYTEDGGDIGLTLINYDYLVNVPIEKTKLLIGGHIGSTRYDEDANILSDSAIAYGIHTGFLYDISKKLSLDLTLGYTKLNLEDTISISGTDVIVNIDDSTTMAVGMNYKF